MRMVLQAYLAEMDESSQFAQNAPGRQLAIEIGRTMPANDSKSGTTHHNFANSSTVTECRRSPCRFILKIHGGFG
jgi:hypothetical protein